MSEGRRFEGADRLGLGVAESAAALEVVDGSGMATHLGEVPAVLDRPGAFGPEALCPADQIKVILTGRCRCRPHAELPTDLVDRYHRVRALVHIDPKYHHGPVAFRPR